MTPGRHCLIAARIPDIKWDAPHNHYGDEVLKTYEASADSPA